MAFPSHPQGRVPGLPNLSPGAIGPLADKSVKRRRLVNDRNTGNRAFPEGPAQVHRPGLAGPVSPRTPGSPKAPVAPGIPALPAQAKYPEAPMMPEVEDISAAAAMARVPGIGQPGAERGMSNQRQRRRRLV
jgi:hypothetical protein